MIKISFESFDIKDYALKSFVEQYKDLMDTWKALDSKAQGNVTIAGIFLAAAFTWSRNSQTEFSTMHQCLLILAIGLLIFSVATAICALFVKKFEHPPFGKKVYEMVKDLESVKINAVHIKNFKNDEIRLWDTTITDMINNLDIKGRRVFIAQLMLLSAAVIFTFLTFLLIIR